MSNPQPFDPGYDYEQDKDIVERLEKMHEFMLLRADETEAITLYSQAAGEIRALRLRIKNQDRIIDAFYGAQGEEVES